ncbi:uncharacterized protein YhhL (DUF1145 family) [Rhodococcus sp. 27YEA15]|uniref:hypothetical protein n=1 Tax=Rhodococcus sp. 27YEA15 TaxID=3156259 RepID=UPI003C7B93B2
MAEIRGTLAFLPLLFGLPRQHDRIMDIIVLVIVVVLALDVAVLIGRTPDSRRDGSSHGEFTL